MWCGSGVYWCGCVCVGGWVSVGVWVWVWVWVWVRVLERLTRVWVHRLPVVKQVSVCFIVFVCVVCDVI